MVKQTNKECPEYVVITNFSKVKKRDLDKKKSESIAKVGPIKWTRTSRVSVMYLWKKNSLNLINNSVAIQPNLEGKRKEKIIKIKTPCSGTL